MVTGTGYRTGAQIEWNGTRIAATTLVSATQLTAAIPASFLTAAGTAPVAVVNTDNGDRSGTVSFTISAPPVSARPSLTSLAPSTAVAGGSAFTLTVNGSGFVSGATVAWVGSARTTTFVSATQLTASIPASDIAAAGSFAVDVAQSGSRSTNQLTFTATPAPPTLASLSPSTIAAGSAGFDLTVTGTGFLNGASVAWNGSNVTTTFVSATQLRAAIPAANLVSARSASVDVVQGGLRSSNQLPFSITTAAPAVTSLAPASAVRNGPAFTLSVDGRGFTSSSVVKWNGTALTTTLRSSTLVDAAVTSGLLSTAGTANITVENSTADGGASAARSFVISEPVTGKIVQLASPRFGTSVSSNVTVNLSPPTLSQDGRYMGFQSYATDLVAGTKDHEYDGYLRDTCVGAAPAGCVPSTTRLTLDATFNESYGSRKLVVLSSNARYAGLESRNQTLISVRDNCIGASDCTSGYTTVNEVPGATNPARLSSCCSTLSPDGRYVLFSSFDPAPTATTISALYVRDTCIGATGCTPTTTRVATGTTGTPPYQPFPADISVGGRYILFRAPGRQIDPALSPTVHLFVEDTCIGAPAGCTVTYTMADTTVTGGESEGNLANDALADEQPSFSKDGRYVVFETTDSHMVAGGTIANVPYVYVRDTCIGAPAGCTPFTTLVTDTTVVPNSRRSFIGFRSVSEHGRYIAYMQESYDGEFHESIVVRDTCIGATAGCVPSSSLVSADPDGLVPSNRNIFLYPSISADGHYAGFMSGAGDVAGGQVYLALTGY
jgi:hypothetical protein